MGHAGWQAEWDVGVLDDVQLAAIQLFGCRAGIGGAWKGAEGGGRAGQVLSGLLCAVQGAGSYAVAIIKLLDVEAFGTGPKTDFGPQVDAGCGEQRGWVAHDEAAIHIKIGADHDLARFALGLAVDDHGIASEGGEDAFGKAMAGKGIERAVIRAGTLGFERGDEAGTGAQTQLVVGEDLGLVAVFRVADFGRQVIQLQVAPAGSGVEAAPVRARSVQMTDDGARQGATA